MRILDNSLLFGPSCILAKRRRTDEEPGAIDKKPVRVRDTFKSDGNESLKRTS